MTGDETEGRYGLSGYDSQVYTGGNGHGEDDSVYEVARQLEGNVLCLSLAFKTS